MCTLNLTGLFTGTITDLQSHPLNNHHLLSTSKDGTARLWDLDQEKCLVVFEAKTALTVSVSVLGCLLVAICSNDASAFILQATHLLLEASMVTCASGLSHLSTAPLAMTRP